MFCVLVDHSLSHSDSCGVDASLQTVAKSNHVQRKMAKRQAERTLDPLLDEQFASGRFIACISSRPGQVQQYVFLSCFLLCLDTVVRLP